MTIPALRPAPIAGWILAAALGGLELTVSTATVVIVASIVAGWAGLVGDSVARSAETPSHNGLVRLLSYALPFSVAGLWLALTVAGLVILLVR